MDEIEEFFGNARVGLKAHRVVQLPGPPLLHRAERPPCSSGSSTVPEHVPLGTQYAFEAKTRALHEDMDADVDCMDSDADADQLETLGEQEPFDDGRDDVFDKYRLPEGASARYKIDDHKAEIMDNVDSHTVTIIEGPTGCGKTTQVPVWILKDAFDKRTPCNIVTTQPRRIAAVTVAKHVCKENDVKLGELIGYQIGLDKQSSQDTRLTFLTTGVLLQTLVSSKSLKKYSHIILDEVHEREKDMDFLLILIKKLIKLKTNRTKIILMSATINIHKFFDYFTDSFNYNLKEVPIVTVKEERVYPLGVYYLNELSKIGQLPDMKKEDPMISNESFIFCLKLICALEEIDKIEEAKNNIQRPCILIFLPGYFEIEELYDILRSKEKREKFASNSSSYEWWLVPLHSTITADEQAKAFSNPPVGFRKIILATNIAESSITVPATKYVIDFCLTKMVICNPLSGFSSLQTCWASKNSCKQRAGRAGRTRSGRVYRLVREDFYCNLDQENIPEMQRTSLENLVLNTKLLDFGSPKNVLGLAMDPPDLSNINRTVLILKEVGGLFNSTSKNMVIDDGEITYIGRIMAKLPLDVRISKLILLGYLFGCLEDCIIMGAAISGKSIFSNPFLGRMAAFNSKLTWSYGSSSDCIAFLNVYKVYTNLKEKNGFSRYDGGFQGWAKSMFLQTKALIELERLICEIKLRLAKEGISHISEDKGMFWSKVEKPLILKMVMAGAFYPHYFVLQSKNENNEREAFKILNGKDPYTTVYLTDMDNRQPGALYAAQLKSIFQTQLFTDVEIEFDAGSRKVFASCSSTTMSPEMENAKIPGKAALFIYQAVKMRHLKIPLILNVMPIEKSLELYSKIEASSVQRNQLNCDNYSLDALPPILPSIDETYIKINITHMQNCSVFWAYNFDEFTIRSLNFVNDILNNSNHGLLNLRNSPLIGRIYVAPYKDNDSSILYYRARVKHLLENNKVYVQFIDYGNSCAVSVNVLKELNPTIKELFKIPPLAFECTLSGIAPSVLKNPSGNWTSEANKRFHVLTANKKLHGKVYSVVQSVIHLELFVDDECINDILVNEDYAQKAEESYASKVNKDLRDRVGDMHPSQITAFNYDQQTRNKNIYSDFLAPESKYCTQRILLKGPYSPLEANLYSVLSTGRHKSSSVEWDSVNSILLNTEPHDRSERLIIAATVNESKTGSSLKLRNTTLMPSVPGLTELITLMFCPTAQLFSNANSDRYVGILCGLGHVNGAPIFGEHDIFININCHITNEDLDNINFLRKTMDFVLKTTKGEESLNIDPVSRADALKTIKQIIKKLMSCYRKQFEPAAVMDPWVWKKEKNTIVDCEAECIFPPHSKLSLNLQQPEILLMLAKENAKIHDICKGSFQSDGNEYNCHICDTGQLNIPSLRLHLQSRIHKDNEAELPII